MLNNKMKKESTVMTDTLFDFDIEGVVDQVWDDLQKKVPQSDIRQAVINILPRYQNARIKSYLFILIQREVTMLLRKQVRFRVTDSESQLENMRTA